MSAVSLPCSASTLPRAMTSSTGSVTRSEVRITSARRPGVMDPSSRSRPKCWAVLRVAIWMAVMGFSPCVMAWRTTRFM